MNVCFLCQGNYRILLKTHAHLCMVLLKAKMFTILMAKDETKYCMLMKILTISSHG